MFSSGQCWADEYKYLGASHCYSSGRLAHISCKSCPQPGRAATLAIYFLFRGQYLFLVQRRRVFALVGGAEVRQGTRFICKQAFASSPAVQPSPSPSTKLLNLLYLVIVFVSISWICISDNLHVFAETQVLPRCNIPLTCSKPLTHNKIMREPLKLSLEKLFKTSSSGKIWWKYSQQFPLCWVRVCIGGGK